MADASPVQGNDIVHGNTSHEQVTHGVCKAVQGAVSQLHPHSALACSRVSRVSGWPQPERLTHPCHLAACLGFEELHEAPFVAGLHPRKDSHLGHSIGLLHRGQGVKLQPRQDGQRRLMGIKAIQGANLKTRAGRSEMHPQQLSQSVEAPLKSRLPV